MKQDSLNSGFPCILSDIVRMIAGKPESSKCNLNPFEFNDAEIKTMLKGLP